MTGQEPLVDAICIVIMPGDGTVKRKEEGVDTNDDGGCCWRTKHKKRTTPRNVGRW